MLLNVSGPSDLGLFEVNEAAEIVAKAAHPDANIIFGAVIDDSLGDEVRITVIAAGFDRFEGERRPRVSTLGLERRRSARPRSGDGTATSTSRSGRRTTATTRTTSSTCPSSSLIDAPRVRRRAPGIRRFDATATVRRGGARRAVRLRQPRHPRGRRPDAARARTAPRLAAALGGRRPGRWVWLDQVHGDTVVVLDAASRRWPPEADAAVTDRPGLPLVVLVADCAPIALVGGRAVGVVHAGWRGTRTGRGGTGGDGGASGRRRHRRRRARGARALHPTWSLRVRDRRPRPSRRALRPGGGGDDRLGHPGARPPCRDHGRAGRRRCRRRRRRAACAPRRRPTTSPTGATARPVARRWWW